MTFDIFEKEKLVGVVKIGDYERIIRCDDCAYFDSHDYDGRCCFHDSHVNITDYCSKAIKKKR